jgi:hypothetical protein
VKETLDANKDWTVEKLEEFFVRIKFIAKRQSRIKDTFFFWIAHAKLLRQLNRKLTTLLAFLAKETKELKAKRKAVMTQLEVDYVNRKKKYPVEIPKYIKHTRIDLDATTFRNVTMTKKIITEKEMTDYFNNETLHNQKCAQLVDLKRQLDAQLEV